MEEIIKIRPLDPINQPGSGYMELRNSKANFFFPNCFMEKPEFFF
jgi:hypothetical protein